MEGESQNFAQTFAELAWIDVVGLVLMGALLLLGFFRGLWWQVIRLLGIVGAVALARALSPRWIPLVSEKFPEMSERVVQGTLWLALFLLGLLVAALLGMLGRRLLEALQLGLLDRTGGALAGGATGLVVHCAVLALLVQLGPHDWVVDTLDGTYSEDVLGLVADRVPLVVEAAEGSELEQLFRTELGLGEGRDRPVLPDVDEGDDGHGVAPPSGERVR